MKYSLLVISLFSLLSPNSSFAQIYKWVDENGHTQFSDKPHPKAQEVKIKSENTQDDKVSKAAVNKKQQVIVEHKSLLNSNILKLRSMLNKKEFSVLNKTIAKIDASYKSNKISEDVWFTAYEAFRIKDTSLTSLFDTWVSTTPDSYQPYLARAIFHYQMGWLSRGGKWASETKEKQMNEMSIHFNKSTEDLIKALNLNGPAVISYNYLIGITNALGRDDEAERFMRKALEIAPASFNVRYHYMETIAPRWGGSLEEMQAYGKESAKHSDLNPKLKMIEGVIFSEAGDMQVISKKYNVADTLYSKSLEFGQFHKTLFKRGKNNNRREKYADSLRDLNSAIALNYEKPLYYYWRASTLIGLKEFEKAMNDIQTAIQLDPYDKDFQSKRMWLAAKFQNDAYTSRESQNNESSIDKYTKAIQLNPGNGDLYQGRARAYIQERDLSSALADMKKAIDVDPDNYHHYALIDYILFKSKDYDQIIKYWEQYIKRHPDDGRAYVEIGGTYFHKGDIKSAVKYAKISADLGNLEGIEAYEKFKHMIQ